MISRRFETALCSASQNMLVLVSTLRLIFLFCFVTSVPWFLCMRHLASFVISTRVLARIQVLLRSTACELLSRPQIFYGSARSTHGTVTGLESRGSPQHQWIVYLRVAGKL